MYLPSCFSFTLLASSVLAKHCENFFVPVTVLARNGIFDLPTLQYNRDATIFFANVTNPAGNFTDEVLLGYRTINHTYDISVKFCRPNASYGRDSTLQFLTHGIGFDKTYWDLSHYSANYSYTDVAVDQYGFSTLAIDRLGIGESSIADPLNIIQAPADLAVIYEMTMMLRRGSLPHVPQAFSRIVHVGHSFGSILSYNLAAAYPTASDGLILTAYTHDTASIAATYNIWASELARNNQPERFARLPTGYLTWANATSNERTFLYPGFFDPAILPYAESHKQPFTTGEILTLGSSPPTVPAFTGPVQVLVGNQDFIFCGGDCTPTTGSASIPAQVASAFPASSAFEAYVQPDTGHGINLHRNATAAYRATQEFLIANGLGRPSSSSSSMGRKTKAPTRRPRPWHRGPPYSRVGAKP